MTGTVPTPKKATEAPEIDTTNQAEVVSDVPTPKKTTNAPKTKTSKKIVDVPVTQPATKKATNAPKTANTKEGHASKPVIQGEFIISIIMFYLLHS